MNFTYDAYIELIKLLKSNSYNFANYKNYKRISRPVIFRHDIDNSLEKALKIARIENENNVKSTYFALLATNFYNIFSKESNEILTEIKKLGHKIGLHFDEKRYVIKDKEDLEKYIEYEKSILEKVIGTKVYSVSMHRPSKWILENDIQFKSIINTYSKIFFNEFKYLSDSRMHWREDVLGIIQSREYDKLNILTHPFWYDEGERDIKERVSKYINNANKERYSYIKDNIRDIEEIMKIEEIL